MKSEMPFSFFEDKFLSDNSIYFTSENPAVLARSIARLTEENNALRRLAGVLTSTRALPVGAAPNAVGSRKGAE
jgi:hypothetical protein